MDTPESQFTFNAAMTIVQVQCYTYLRMLLNILVYHLV